MKRNDNANENRQKLRFAFLLTEINEAKLEWEVSLPASKSTISDVRRAAFSGHASFKLILITHLFFFFSFQGRE